MTALPALKLDPPALRDHGDVTTGMTDDHRRVYTLLVNAPHGLTREQLASRSGLSDRRARQVVEELRVVAAVIPNPAKGHGLVIGFDPDQQVYKVAANRAEADAIMAYHASRVRKMLAALDAQEEAAREAFGESPASRAVQEVLFDGMTVLKSRSAWRGG